MDVVMADRDHDMTLELMTPSVFSNYVTPDDIPNTITLDNDPNLNTTTQLASSNSFDLRNLYRGAVVAHDHIYIQEGDFSFDHITNPDEFINGLFTPEFSELIDTIIASCDENTNT